MDAKSSLQEQIAAEAADWFVRLQDGTDAQAREEFAHWLLRSSAHVEEYLAVTRAWSDVQLAAEGEFSTEQLISDARAQGGADNIIELSPRAANHVPAADACGTPAAGRWRWLAAAGFLLTLASLWFGLRDERIETAIGEQRTLALSDGSIVYVNTDSELAIDLQPLERRVRLLRGEARFDVAKDPQRPFIVSTPQASVRAVGTSFNVQSVFKRTAVAVLEGRVEVTSKHAGAHADAGVSPAPGATRAENNAAASTRTAERPADRPAQQSLQLEAGERAAVTNAGDIVPRAGPPLERVLAWTERRLEFRDEPLSTVVAEFNRYSTQPVYVTDPLLARHRISGSFAVRDVASLLQFLEQYQDVSIEEGADGSRLLRRRPNTPAPQSLQST